MTGNGPALLAAAAGVGLGHAILPDHWVPLAVVSRARRWPLRRVARLAALAAAAHVLVSIVLGGVVVVIGLQFRSAVQRAQDTVIGLLLVATGVGFAALQATGRDHHHHPHDPGGGGHGHGPGGHGHDPAGHGDGPAGPDPASAAQVPGHHGHAPRRLAGLAEVVVPFGAAASPDLTILPVFLAATAAGAGTAVGSLAIFAAVTIATIVGLTLAASRGGYQIRGQWLERWGNGCTALVLVIIGALVLAGVI